RAVPRLNSGRDAIDREPAAGREIGERQGEEDREPEKASRDDDLRQPRAPANVHEDENDERRLPEGDRQRRDGVPGPEVDERDGRRGGRQREQRQEDQKVRPGRDNVIGRGVGHQVSAISYQLSAISYRLSAISQN